MLQSMLNPLQKVFDVPFKRVIKFALKSSLGRFLQHDLHFEQFCVSLSSGHAELHDLELDTEEICRALGAEELPFDLTSVRVGLVRVEAFGGDEEGLFVHLARVEVHIRPRNGHKSSKSSKDVHTVDNDKNESQSSFQSRQSRYSRKDSTTKPAGTEAERKKPLPADLELEDPDIDYGESLETPLDSELSQAAMDGLDTLGRWIEEYAAGLRIEAVDVAIYVSAGSAPGSDIPNSEQKPMLILRCPRMLFGATTADGPDPSQNSGEPPSSSSTAGKSNTAVVERSIKIDETTLHIKYTDSISSESKEHCVARIKKGTTAQVRTSLQNDVTIVVPSILAVINPTLWNIALEMADKFTKHETPSSSVTKVGLPGITTMKPAAATMTTPVSGLATSVAEDLKRHITKQGGTEEEEDYDFGSHSDVDEFFDAEDGSSDSFVAGEGKAGESASMLYGSLTSTPHQDLNSSIENNPLSIRVVLQRLQVEFMYRSSQSCGLQTPAPIRRVLDRWPDEADTASEIATNVSPADSFSSDSVLLRQLNGNLSRHDSEPRPADLARLILQVEGAQFAANLAEQGNKLRANITLQRFGALELLPNCSHGSLSKSTQFSIHRVLDMQPNKDEVACHVDLVRGTSMLVQLSALALSWDNGMVAQRMAAYLPEPSPRAEDSESQNRRPGPAANSTNLSNASNSSADFHLRVVSPRALIILRVPSSLPKVKDTELYDMAADWLPEAMVLDMCNVSAQTGSAARQEEPHRLGINDGSGGMGRSAFYDEVEELRNVIWSLVLDFTRVRAGVKQIEAGALPLHIREKLLGNSSTWALVVDGANGSNSDAPRLSVSVRQPFTSPMQSERTSLAALSLARRSRRAFKRRVHQRRAPGEEGGSHADPAGDHDLDKDQEPPLYEVMEAVSTHGFCTADTAVRLLCPDAVMSIDRVQYHSLNAALQLILGSLPSFTRGLENDCEVNAYEERIMEDAPQEGTFKYKEKEDVLFKQDEEPLVYGQDPQSFDVLTSSFWDDEDNPSNSNNSEPDIARGHAEVCGVVLSHASSTFFQMCSRGGRVELIDKLTPDFELDYSGLELIVVDSKTMAEAQDVTLLESSASYHYGGGSSLEPIFHSTKWGRNESSSPLLQIFMDGDPQLAAKNTSVLHVCVDGLTLQLLPQSLWLQKLSDFLTSAPPPNAVGAHDMRSQKPASNSGEACTSQVPLVSYTEVTIEFFDAVVEYRSCERPQNMALVGLGMVRMSSNVASPVVRDQSYHLTARDFALYVSNDAPKQEPSRIGYELLSSKSSPFSSIEDFVASMLFAKVASLDMVELFIRCRNLSAEAQERKANRMSADVDVDPDTDYEVSIPNVSLYSCTDSFCTLEGLMHDLIVELSGRSPDVPVPKEEESTDFENPMLKSMESLDNTIYSAATENMLDNQEDEARCMELQAPNVVREPFAEAEDIPDKKISHTGAPDDEHTASELRHSYLTPTLPDDQLSGPQLRSRHAYGQDPDPDAIFVDGFYAVDNVSVVPASTSPSAALTSDVGRVTGDQKIGSLTTPAGNEGVGTWFHIEESAPNSLDHEILHGGNTDTADENEDEFSTMGNEFLIWGDPTSGALEEMELDEWPKVQVPDCKDRALSFEAEEAEERLAEAQVQEDSRRAAREREQAMADFAHLYKREYPDQVLQASGDFAILETSPSTNTQIRGRVQEGVSIADDDDGSPSGWYEDVEVRIYPHYMGIPFEAGPGSHVPTAEALAARMEGRASLRRRVAPCSSRIVVRDISVRWFLFGGCDWNSTAETVEHSRKRRKEGTGLQENSDYSQGVQDSGSGLSTSAVAGTSIKKRERHPLAGRQNDRKLEIILSHGTALITTYATTTVRGPCIAESVAIAVRDFGIIDHIASSEIHTMVGEWISDAEHPRISGSSMLRVALDRVEREVRDSLFVRASILPVKANLDQDSLEFLLDYLAMRVGTDGAAFAEPRQQSSPHGTSDTDSHERSRGQHRHGGSPNKDDSGADDSDLDVMMDGESSSDGCLTGEDADIVLVENTDWFIESADIRAFKVKLDYRPKRVDLKGLVAGDRMALVNLFAYEGLQVSLRRVELESIRGGWRELWEHVQVSWAHDVQRQRHRCLAGVSFPPINKVATLGSGLTNLVLMPLEQYQKDGRIVHGIRRGTASFVRTVAIEALGTFSMAAQTAQTLLEHARDVLSPLPPGAEFGGRDRLIRNSITDRDSDVSGISSAGRGAPGLVPPQNVKEGLERGADSFTREVKRAAFVLVALPYDELQRTGPTAAVKSVLRGVPIAVIRPLIGATQAVSSTLIGIRNSVDPDARAEDAQKYKSHSARD